MNHSALIERYAAGPGILEKSVAGLGPAELDAFPVPGTWSIRQIVVHLLDSDLIATHRMRRIVAEELPLLLSYDETAFSNKLFYPQTDLSLSLRLFRDNRAWTVDLLRRLDPAAFARQGVHNQRGKISLEDIVKMYSDHVDHHVAFVVKKRAMLGKAL